MALSSASKREIAASWGEAELVERARGGDEMAFRLITERHNRRLYRIARTILQNDAEAEDAVQESYLRAFAALPGFRGLASLSTWLTRIVINEALGRKRKQRPTIGLEEMDAIQQNTAQVVQFPNMNSDTDPERSAAQRQIRALLEQSIDALPESFRVVFVMRDVEEMSIEETATFLGIRPETVKTRLHRARRLLRRSLDEHVASTLKGAFPFAGARCARITEAVLSRLSAGTASA